MAAVQECGLRAKAVIRGAPMSKIERAALWCAFSGVFYLMPFAVSHEKFIAMGFMDKAWVLGAAIVQIGWMVRFTYLRFKDL